MMGWSVQLTAPVLPLSPQVAYFASFRKKLCPSYVIEVAVITERKLVNMLFCQQKNMENSNMS